VRLGVAAGAGLLAGVSAGGSMDSLAGVGSTDGPPSLLRFRLNSVFLVLPEDILMDCERCEEDGGSSGQGS